MFVFDRDSMDAEILAEPKVKTVISCQNMLANFGHVLAALFYKCKAEHDRQQLDEVNKDILQQQLAMLQMCERTREQLLGLLTQYGTDYGYDKPVEIAVYSSFAQRMGEQQVNNEPQAQP